MDVSLLKNIQNKIEEKIKSDILRSGTVQNPRLLGIKSVLYVIMAIAVSAPAGIVLSILYGPIFLGIILAPLILSGTYFVILRMQTMERKTAIEDELAPFAAMASIMESAHVSLFSTLSSIADNSGIFPVMRREGLRVKTITALGRAPTSALMELADTHPNMQFRRFIEGYVSSWNTGGSDTSAYLQEQSHRFFQFMQNKMTRYTKQADSIAQIILTVMLLLPMMGLSMTFFASGHLAATMMLLLITSFPFITVVLLVMVQVKQPRSMVRIKISLIPFVAGGVCVMVVYLIRDVTWEALGIGVVVACFLNAFFLRAKFAEIADAEEPLVEFMRQMTRFRNIGIDIMSGIQNISADIALKSKPVFNRTFDNIIDSLYRKMISGRTLEEAVSKTAIHSHNARVIFFILGKIHESGGGTAKTLDDITRWVTEYADAKKEMIISLRASLLTAFVGPVLMVMMSVVSGQLVSEFDNTNIPGFNAGFDGMATAGLSEILTVMASACMGVVLSKINYFTVRHTTFTGTITAVTLAMLYAIPYLPEFEL